ncbi:DUF1924 domain-containing protein [Pseudothauera rhizosphaerae]|uniref:DUF1924 domain-containing protein n=1 Tax=Pseudothauera rhizosphaerae TaxID=2565932 RepID=A0A4S4AY85_9RHOO|nr:DUF1924 domain-containing protein [Pseudothauera rhizosphaerae]THF65078.1 DUF1924 domain-containing protein [Pseudothauera rhizosphaerae]
MKADLRAIAAVLALALPPAVGAAGVDEQLDRYAAQARAEDPGFAGFSALRGEQFHHRDFSGGKPDTPSCATCHGDDPVQPGRTRTGKAIEPMALSASPARYGDEAKVEKWFRRNCREVLGRECSAVEKGDWLSYVRTR